MQNMYSKGSVWTLCIWAGIGEADKVPFVWATSKGVDLNGQRNFGWIFER